MGWSLYDLRQNLRWHATMFWPTVQDNLNHYGLLEPIEKSASRMSLACVGAKHTVSEIFSARVSDVPEAEIPEFIVKKRLEERRFQTEIAEDAIIIQNELPSLSYKP